MSHSSVLTVWQNWHFRCSMSASLFDIVLSPNPHVFGIGWHVIPIMPSPTMRSRVSSVMAFSIFLHDHGVLGAINLSVQISYSSDSNRSMPHTIGTPTGSSLDSRMLFSAVLVKFHACLPARRMCSLVTGWRCTGIHATGRGLRHRGVVRNGACDGNCLEHHVRCHAASVLSPSPRKAGDWAVVLASTGTANTLNATCL